MRSYAASVCWKSAHGLLHAQYLSIGLRGGSFLARAYPLIDSRLYLFFLESRQLCIRLLSPQCADVNLLRSNEYFNGNFPVTYKCKKKRGESQRNSNTTLYEVQYKHREVTNDEPLHSHNSTGKPNSTGKTYTKATKPIVAKSEYSKTRE